MDSVAATQFCPCTVKATTDGTKKTSMNVFQYNQQWWIGPLAVVILPWFRVQRK